VKIELNFCRNFNPGMADTHSDTGVAPVIVFGPRARRPCHDHGRDARVTEGGAPVSRRNGHSQTNRIPLAFAAALALVSCNNNKIEVYRIPKEGVTVAMQSGSAGLQPPPPSTPAKWVKPEGWNEQPLSEMRLGSFKVDGPNATSADISVTAFPGDAGGLAPNVNRWRGQLQLPALAEDQLEQSIQRIEVEGVPAYLVDIQTTENAPKPARILGAVLDTSDRVWFVKMTGSPDLIESQREKFLDFVKSFRFTAVTDSQAPETGNPDKPKSTNDK
jgi:hypothetical protein